MKSQVNLLLHALREQGDACGIRTDKDVDYILARWKEEGDSFVTITLPTFDKGLTQALAEGVALPSHWPAFGSRGGLPKFLSGFLRKIFLPNGSVRPTTDSVLNAIRAVRQVTLLNSKVFMVCDDKRVAAAMRAYREVDAEIPDLSRDLMNRVTQVTNRYFGAYFQDVENTLYREGINPIHGSGSVANRLAQNAKWNCNIWTDRLETIFPAYDTLCVGPRDFVDSRLVYLSEGQEPPVRVIPVPKTMKAPRIIAMEPSWMMYVQQGILSSMTSALDRHPWVNDLLGWTDQEPNRTLSANWEAYATLDLSEASDRVPLAMVEAMLARFPLLREAVLACRTRKAELPDGDIVHLRKFASMGSALCFPFESFCFAIAVLIGAEDVSNPIHPRTFSVRKARIFGDDLVIPLDSVPTTLETLKAFGFKVNVNKSFWTGKFRESCGADWYDHHNVSVVKVRQSLPESRLHGSSVMKAVDLHNRLFERGLFKSAQYLETLLCELGFGYYAPPSHYSLALWTYDDSKLRLRFNPSTHNFELRTLKARSTQPLDKLEGWGALRKYLRGRPRKKPFSEDHLERAGRAQRVAIHAGWSGLHQRVVLKGQ